MYVRYMYMNELGHQTTTGFIRFGVYLVIGYISLHKTCSSIRKFMYVYMYSPYLDYCTINLTTSSHKPVSQVKYALTHDIRCS